jgi:putative ABC transport system substrate-binding protein
MIKKIFGFLVAVVISVSFHLAEAQQSKKVPLIGTLNGGSVSSIKSQYDAFREGLRELSYVEGKNIVIESRHADGNGDRLPDLAAELVRRKVDIILVGGTQTTTAAKRATSTIPIVVGSAGDLVGSGVVASLAHPGGNVTGSTSIDADLSGKRLEILKEAIPKASRVALLWHRVRGDVEDVKEIEAEARRLRMKVQIVEVGDPAQFQSAFAAMAREHADALIIIQGSFTSSHRIEILELAVKRRLPTMCEDLRWTTDGCLVSYGPDILNQWKRAAVFVDKILKGRTPADLPVEQPMKFELIINLKIAKQIGVTIPQWTLMKADKVFR